MVMLKLTPTSVRKWGQPKDDSNSDSDPAENRHRRPKRVPSKRRSAPLPTAALWVGAALVLCARLYQTVYHDELRYDFSQNYESARTHAKGPSRALTQRAVLGLNDTASLAEVRRAYKKIAASYHPDVNGACADCLDKYIDVGIACVQWLPPPSFHYPLTRAQGAIHARASVRTRADASQYKAILHDPLFGLQDPDAELRRAYEASTRGPVEKSRFDYMMQDREWD